MRTTAKKERQAAELSARQEEHEQQNMAGKTRGNLRSGVLFIGEA